MADVTAAPEQDAIADSLVSEETAEQVAEQPGEQPEQEVSEQPQEQEQQEQVEETAEDWLPTDQDKVFPDEVYARYAQRYNLTPEQATDPLLRQLLHDKINSDIFIQQQQQIEQQEPEPQPEPTREQPQVSREQHFNNLARVVAERTDPEVAKQFHSEFMSIWQRPAAEQPMAFTQVASKYMLNLVNTFLPDMLQAQLGNQLGQAFPGFSDMYERSSMAMAWDRVRNSDQSFASLPAYGTKEFSSTLREAAARIPGFDEMQFTDQQGRPLPPQQNAERKYAMLAKMASGQNVNPQLLQQAAAAGARNARRADVRRSAGNLGSGQSQGARQATGSSKFQSNQDLFDDETMALYQREHGKL
jgi:hypothetical protein